MSEAYLNKHDCLARAKNLLASGDAASLRYAALELRFCMEAVTYEKLRAYSSRLPADMLSRWQPPQAVAALQALEDEADQEYTVAFGLRRGDTTGPLQVIGEHRAFATAWLHKHYNKLGSVLHVPNENDPGRGPEPMDPQVLREYLEGVAAECERVVESSITSTLAPVVEFECQLCGRKAVANSEAAKRRARASCLDPGCGAEHVVTVDTDGSLYFRLSGPTFPCQGCGHKLLIADKLISEGYEFGCGKCGRRHKIVDRVWRYAAEVESGEGAS